MMRGDSGGSVTEKMVRVETVTAGLILDDLRTFT